MSDLVNKLIEQFRSKSQYQKFVRESEQKFDINTYRFQQMTQATVRKIYNQLRQKYHQKQLQESPRSWHQNQRKVFVWVVLGLLKMLNDSNTNLENQHWNQLSLAFFNKDLLFLKYQYNAIQKKKKRGQWTSDEDQIMRSCQQHIQKNNWNQIAKQIFFQTNGRCFKGSKQCRQRWQNHLDNNIKKQQWSNEEDLIILQFVRIDGKKWSKIVQKLNNTRTQHMVKNRYKSLIAKSQLLIKKERKQTSTEEELITFLIYLIQRGNGKFQQHSLSNQSEQNDKIDEQIPQLKIKGKKALCGIIERGQNGQFASSHIFEQKSPRNMSLNLANSLSFLTPISLTPTDSLYGGFHRQTQYFNEIFAKKQSFQSCASEHSDKMFGFRNDSNILFSQQYKQIQSGSLPSPSSVERIQSFQMFSGQFTPKINQDKGKSLKKCHPNFKAEFNSKLSQQNLQIKE